MDPFKFLMVSLIVTTLLGVFLIVSGWTWTGLTIVVLPLAFFFWLANLRI